MILLSPKMVAGSDNKNLVWCPGCECIHGVRVAGESGPVWQWNGDVLSPTFSPSILVQCEHRCHSYLRDGVWQFLSDCDHQLAGQHVPLPDLPVWFTDGLDKAAEPSD